MSGSRNALRLSLEMPRTTTTDDDDRYTTRGNLLPVYIIIARPLLYNRLAAIHGILTLPNPIAILIDLYFMYL